ncbi:MAG: hypothetical protein R2688_09185 [Fimbriimonadaceae bacterium]
MDFLEQTLGIDNIALEPKLFHHAGAAIKAYGIFVKDVNYVVRNGEVVIVDENTGRMMFGDAIPDGFTRLWKQRKASRFSVKAKPLPSSPSKTSSACTTSSPG